MLSSTRHREQPSLLCVAHNSGWLSELMGDNSPSCHLPLSSDKQSAVLISYELILNMSDPQISHRNAVGRGENQLYK